MASVIPARTTNDAQEISQKAKLKHSDKGQAPSGARRAKYSRPCDGCAVRKVRCSDVRPCTRCLNNGIVCTSNRIRKKCGPKAKNLQKAPYYQGEPLHIPISNISAEPPATSSRNSSLDSKPMTIQDVDGDIHVGHFHNNSTNTRTIPPNMGHAPIFSIDILLPCLQVYQTWYYGVWPVLSVAHLVSQLATVDLAGPLTQEISVSYSLCLAVCAAISRQVAFLSENSNIIKLPEGIGAKDYVRAALSVREQYEHRLQPSYETLLTSFFLYVYYINVKGGTAAAIMHLREAISIGQILRLHDPEAYLSKPPAEVHRLRKIFYLLLVTERFMCIEDSVPVILDSSIPYPSLEDEEYSGLLTGFTELVKIFSIPDRLFFEKMSIASRNENNRENYEALQSFFHMPSSSLSEGWVIDVENRIKSISISHPTSDIEKVNILLSKHWMRSLIWHIAYQNGLLSSRRGEDDCLSLSYPVTIAHEFLSSTSNLPIYAFESNGPGVVVKMLEIANGLADSMSDLAIVNNFMDSGACHNALNSIFWLISKFKTDVTLPVKLYNRIEKIVNGGSIPRPRFSSDLISEIELLDDDVIREIEGSESSTDSQEIISIRGSFTNLLEMA
ncbi:putative sucrose utilization protein SUC1 [Scheffersomyces xylosifermentans]|uniref:putative sucrose utilization protein SUC1 n=1 Tax=Scheffersomyces xylosifermentans TaxID=1304137 RepID=UPI00315C6559